MSAASPVPLQVFGCHSLLSGVISPEALVAAAAHMGYDAIALTDENALMGSVAFVRAARAAGIRPILGATLAIPGERVTVLATSAAGYAATARLLSAIARGKVQDLASALAREPGVEDLIVLCGAAERLARWKGLMDGRGELCAAVTGFRGRDEGALRRTADALGLARVAVGEVHFLRAEDRRAHRILRAAALGTVVQRLPEDALAPTEACLVSPAEFAARHAQDPASLAATRRIAEQCADFTVLGTPRLPEFHLPAGQEASAWLRELAFTGARERYGDPLPPEVQSRLAAELEVIADLGFPGYFLVVREIVTFARARGIPFVGRGSAADSLVVYCLGFTRVCPLEHELVFERFLSRSRPNLPDIDLDFCWRRRDEVIAHVYERYGEDRVATISTHVRFRLRSAFREAAKALGLPPAAAEDGGEALPHHFEGGLAEALEQFPECRRLAERPKLRAILEAAEAIRGLPRHLGMHPGGMVIANQPVTDFTPLVPSAKGPLITQHEMRGIEALGLVKMDLLGQRSLSTIADTLNLIATGTSAPPPDLSSIAKSDPRAQALLREGRTLGCFQIESPGMRKLLVGLRAAERDDLTHAIALIRPGPAGSGMKDAFVRRRQGEEEISFDHPRLERVLGRTLGIMLFQEDILRVSAALAGWSLADGDLVRSAIGKKKDPAKLKDLKAEYETGCAREGIPPCIAAAVWARIGDFAAFSFCKAHAATYGQLAWEELWLKAHHPAAFFCAVLNNQRGYYPQRVYLEEARRHGVRFLLPDINRSALEFAFERGAIRIGLGQVKGLSAALLERWAKARAAGPFLSLPDLLERLHPDRREATHLIRCGALDGFDRPRPEQLWRLELLHKARPVESHGTLFAEEPRAPILPRLADYEDERKRRDEYELLGMTAEGTESVYAHALGEGEFALASELKALRGREVRCHGWVSASRRTRTKEGRLMRFLTLEDATGMIDTVLFPEVYEAYGHHLRGEGPYVISGRVEDEHGAIVVLVRTLEPAL